MHTNVNKGKWRWAIVLTVSSPFIVGQPFDLMSEDGIRYVDLLAWLVVNFDRG